MCACRGVIVSSIQIAVHIGGKGGGGVLESSIPIVMCIGGGGGVIESSIPIVMCIGGGGGGVL